MFFLIVSEASFPICVILGIIQPLWVSVSSTIKMKISLCILQGHWDGWMGDACNKFVFCTRGKPSKYFQTETTWVSIDRWMDKEDVVHMHNGILLSHKKEWNNENEKRMPFAATWMDLEIIILSAVSQTEKGKCHMISLICGI